MNDLSNNAMHLEPDAREIIRAIEDDTAAACAEISEKYEKTAQDEYWKLFRKGTKEAQLRVDCLSRVAELEAKKQLLALKQEMVSLAFDLAIEKILNLPEDEYIDFLTRLAVKGSKTGNEQIVLSASDRARFGKIVCIKANKALADAGKTGSLTLSEQSRDTRGGLYLASGKIEVNCSIEALVSIQKKHSSFEIAAILFD